MRTRRGIASHTGPSAGTGPDGDRNSAGPRSRGPGPAAGARARDRDNDRREPHTRLAHVRAARAVNTNRVFFILGATFLLLLCLLFIVFLFFFFFFVFSILLFRLFFPPSSFSCFRLFFFETSMLPRRVPLARGDFALLFFFFIKLPRGIFYWKM